MTSNQKDTLLDMLEEKLAYHQTKVKNIKAAILAYNGGYKQEEPKLRVSWTEEILELLRGGISLTLTEIRDALACHGIKEAQTAKGRSSIQTTLKRMTNNGTLNKISDGHPIPSYVYQLSNILKKSNKD